MSTRLLRQHCRPSFHKRRRFLLSTHYVRLASLKSPSQSASLRPGGGDIYDRFPTYTVVMFEPPEDGSLLSHHTCVAPSSSPSPKPSPPEILGANSGGRDNDASAATSPPLSTKLPPTRKTRREFWRQIHHRRRRRKVTCGRWVPEMYVQTPKDLRPAKGLGLVGRCDRKPFLARRWWGLLWDRGSWEKFRGRGHATGVGRMAGKSSHVPGVMHHPGRAPQHPCSHSAPAKAAGPGRDSSERKGRSLSPSRAKLLL